jgi:Acetoacetate decarboxylase (ADC)
VRVHRIRLAVRILAVMLLGIALAGCAPMSITKGGTCGTTPPFMGPCDFDGTYEALAVPSISHGQSRYVGHVLFANLDRNIVAAVLPSELRLATKASAPSTVHPVILLYGDQLDTSWALEGVSQIPGDQYKELILLIPFVTAPSGTKWHTFVARMYLNDDAAIWLGNMFYGYAKEPGTFNEVTDGVTVNASSIAHFQANWTVLGPWRTSDQARMALPNYIAIEEIFAMPVVGMIGTDFGDVPTCSYFEWIYDSAEVASLQSQFQFLEPFRAGMQTWVALGSVNSVPDGAIAIRNVTWRLAWPAPTPWWSCKF